MHRLKMSHALQEEQMNSDDDHVGKRTFKQISGGGKELDQQSIQTFRFASPDTNT